MQGQNSQPQCLQTFDTVIELHKTLANHSESRTVLVNGLDESCLTGTRLEYGPHKSCMTKQGDNNQVYLLKV